MKQITYQLAQGLEAGLALLRRFFRLNLLLGPQSQFFLLLLPPKLHALPIVFGLHSQKRGAGVA